MESERSEKRGTRSREREREIYKICIICQRKLNHARSEEKVEIPRISMEVRVLNM